LFGSDRMLKNPPLLFVELTRVIPMERRLVSVVACSVHSSGILVALLSVRGCSGSSMDADTTVDVRLQALGRVGIEIGRGGTDYRKVATALLIS
jgi:hypothetical protein